MVSSAMPWLVFVSLLYTSSASKEVLMAEDESAMANSSITTSTASTTYVNVTMTATMREPVLTSTATLPILTVTTDNAAGNMSGELILALNNAFSFLQETNLVQVLQKAIGTLGTVPDAWVRIDTITLGAKFDPHWRRLGEKEDVHIRWTIEIPVGSMFSKSDVADSINDKSLAEASQVLNTWLTSELAGSYEAEVKSKLVHFHRRSTTLKDVLQSPSNESESNWSILLFIALVAVGFLAITGSCLYVRCHRKDVGDLPISLPKRPSSQKKFIKVGGPLVEKSVQELMLPPESILQRRADEVRQLARAMIPAKGWEAEVFLTFAVGQRDTDAASCGPEMFYALAVLRFLHDNNVECFSELMLSHSKDPAQFCDLLQRSPCRILIVLQTKTLYDSLEALEEIYVAQQSNIELFPLRFEADLPKYEDEWPQVTLDDLHAQLMLQSVQAKFSQLNSIPSPPFSVQEVPHVLTDVVVDLKVKLGRKAKASSDCDTVAAVPSIGCSMSIGCSLSSGISQLRIKTSDLVHSGDSAEIQASWSFGGCSEATGTQELLRSQCSQELIRSAYSQELIRSQWSDSPTSSPGRVSPGKVSPGRVSPGRVSPGQKQGARRKSTRERKSARSPQRSSRRLPIDCPPSDSSQALVAGARRRTKKSAPEAMSPSRDPHPKVRAPHVASVRPHTDNARNLERSATHGNLVSERIGCATDSQQIQALTRKRPKRHTAIVESLQGLKGTSPDEAAVRSKAETI